MGGTARPFICSLNVFPFRERISLQSIFFHIVDTHFNHNIWSAIFHGFILIKITFKRSTRYNGIKSQRIRLEFFCELDFILLRARLLQSFHSESASKWEILRSFDICKRNALFDGLQLIDWRLWLLVGLYKYFLCCNNISCLKLVANDNSFPYLKGLYVIKRISKKWKKNPQRHKKASDEMKWNLLSKEHVGCFFQVNFKSMPNKWMLKWNEGKHIRSNLMKTVCVPTVQMTAIQFCWNLSFGVIL